MNNWKLYKLSLRHHPGWGVCLVWALGLGYSMWVGKPSGIMAFIIWVIISLIPVVIVLLTAWGNRKAYINRLSSKDKP